MIKNTTDYNNLFFKELNTRKYFTTHNKSIQYTPQKDELWLQCYNPEDAIRRQLPVYWFISNHGNLISMYGEKPYLLLRDCSDNTGSESYHFKYKKPDGSYATKNIEVHNLVNIVFNGYRYGKAKNLLEEKGIFAFGINTKSKDNINGHHIFGKSQSGPNDTELVTTGIHTMINKVPKLFSTIGANLDYMRELGNIVSIEEEKTPSILITGQKYKSTSFEPVIDTGSRAICNLSTLKLSETAMIQLCDIANDIYNICNTNCSNNS